MTHNAIRLRPRAAIGTSILAALTMLTFSGCGSKTAPAKPASPEPVGVVTLKAQSVPITTELPGRLTAFRIAQVRPQVSGIIRNRSFVEGSDVTAGQQLYQIDPAPYQAVLDSSAASLMNAQAALVAAKLKADRYKSLAEYNAISKLDLVNAQADEQQDEANVAVARAAVETARINLRYTKVLSPITGRSGRSTVTEGALVTGNQGDVLTTVQQIDPIYVDVAQPSTVLLRLKREYAAGKLKQAGPQQTEVRLILDDGSTYPQIGKLQFSEVTVDQSTGAVMLRAVFPNPDHLLLPGMFVHMRIAEGVSQHALLVPQQGITRDSEGQATALVVGQDNKVKQCSVVTSRAIGDKWLVTGGLAAGDRVIVSGLQHVKPGDLVKPQQVADDAVAAGSADKLPDTKTDHVPEATQAN